MKSKPLTPIDAAVENGQITKEEAEKLLSGTQVQEEFKEEFTKPVLNSQSTAELVHEFFTTNHIKPRLIVINELNVWDGTGYILNDKPLLKVTYEKGD